LWFPLLQQAKQLVLQLSQPVAAICYKASDRAAVSKQGSPAATALLEQVPDVVGECMQVNLSVDKQWGLCHAMNHA
jgi:hypothetical protein